MIEIKYETPEKEITTRIQDDNMYWKELVEHFINLLPSMGYDGINTEDIILVLHKYLDSTGDVRQEDSDKPTGDMFDTPELTPHNYNMNWNREEDDVPEEDLVGLFKKLNVIGDDKDSVEPEDVDYTDVITDEEDY